jgi:uncharacterized 2Fe-2S/4Fe-4S cluster protein (DUF4445 family)
MFVATQKVRIVFQPSGRRGEIEKGKTLLEASQELGVDINSLCGAKQVCGKCKVKIEEGRFEKLGIQSSMNHLTKWQPSEEKFIDQKEMSEGYRLACSAKLKGDVLVYVPEESRVSEQVVRKAAREIEIALNPAVKLYHVELAKPSLDNPTGDFERLTEKLAEVYGLRNLVMDYFALVDLPDVLRNADWKITAAIWKDREIIRLYPGCVEESWGLAVDIGTTTVAAYLCSLTTGEVRATESMMNPQVTYGEDVMSRITYAMDHPDSGLETMKTQLVKGLNDMIARIVNAVGIARTDILDMTLVGNTAMHHILLQINPKYIGASPFAPAIHSSLDIKTRDLGIVINESSYVHILPIEAGFVGADNVGVLISREPYRKDETQLIIDIGTNGEIVLGHGERMISASCATGPALEGAQISCGMRAAPGAIERIHIDPETLEVSYELIGNESGGEHSSTERAKAKGICGSGIIDVLGELYRAGVIEGSGAFRKTLNTPRLRTDGDGKVEFVIVWKDETPTGRDIVVTQQDIRQIQLAKAAIYAGTKLLMRRLGVDRVDRVVIAGAFGTYVDKDEALVIGMIPSISPDRIIAVGNAAGDGARVALLNKEKREEANWVARKVEYLELTTEKDFQDEFVAALHIPHSQDFS